MHGAGAAEQASQGDLRPGVEMTFNNTGKASAVSRYPGPTGGQTGGRLAQWPAAQDEITGHRPGPVTDFSLRDLAQHSDGEHQRPRALNGIPAQKQDPVLRQDLPKALEE